MRFKLLFAFIASLFFAPTYAQTNERQHKEEPARPIKSYQGVKKIDQVFFLPTEELKSCFLEEKIPVGFPGYNSSLDEAYNKKQVQAWLDVAENKEKLNDIGIRKIKAYIED